MELHSDADAPRRARRLLEGWLRPNRTPSIAQNAQLLLSELVSNAVAHAPGDGLMVTLVATAGRIRCEVTSAGSYRLEPLVVSPDTTSGRGLYIVHTVASRWGWASADGATTAWFELDHA